MYSELSQYYIVVFDKDMYDNDVDRERFPHIGSIACFSHYDFLYANYGFNIFSNFGQKIKFLLTLYCSQGIEKREENLDLLLTEIQAVFPEIRHLRFTHDMYGNDFLGYIGQSEELLEFAIKKEKITLHEFLTNKKYLVLFHTGVYKSLPELFSSPLINFLNINKVYSKETMKHESY